MSYPPDKTPVYTRGKSLSTREETVDGKTSSRILSESNLAQSRIRPSEEKTTIDPFESCRSNLNVFPSQESTAYPQFALLAQVCHQSCHFKDDQQLDLALYQW
jgi:hypothetical protein